MSALVKRAPLPSAPGMLCKEHSHSAWVTNDLDRAVEVFAKRYGVNEFSFLEGPSPTGGHIRVAFAWAGGQVLEILHGTGPGFEFYTEMLPNRDDIEFITLTYKDNEALDEVTVSEIESHKNNKIDLKEEKGKFCSARQFDLGRCIFLINA